MKKFNKLIALSCLALVAAPPADARPAPWYQWRSKLDGAVVCSQTPLGSGWERTFGPYQDSHCTKRLAHE